MKEGGREKSSESQRKKKRDKKSIISKNMNMNHYKLPPLPSTNVAIVSKIDMGILIDQMAHNNIKQPEA